MENTYIVLIKPQIQLKDFNFINSFDPTNLPCELKTLICLLWMKNLRHRKVNNLSKVIPVRHRQDANTGDLAAEVGLPHTQTPLPLSLTKYLSRVFGLFTAILSQ